jgi:hypothetical protein
MGASSVRPLCVTCQVKAPNGTNGDLFRLYLLSRYAFLGASRTTARTWHNGFTQELIGTLVLWALWLIGAAWTTVSKSDSISR